MSIKQYVAEPTIANVSKLKKFIGEKAFESILSGIGVVEIPLEEEKFKELMEIVFKDYYLEENSVEQITYPIAEEAISFFCEPFAGTRLKQVKSTLHTVSSMLQELDPVVLTAMGSSFSQAKNSNSSNASSSQTETSKEETNITIASHSQL